MKGKIGIGIAAIVVVAVIAVVLVFGTGVFATPYWENETEFGMWQTEIVIEFADGTTESLKIIQETWGNPFSVWYGGKEITCIGMEISAKVTGTDFDGAELKYTNTFGTKKIIEDMATNVLYSGVSKRPDGTIQEIPVDTTAPILTSWINVKQQSDDNPEKFPTGNYYAIFEPQGTVEYRGYPDAGDNPWKSASLPPDRSVTVSVIQTVTGQIVVTLSGETRTK